VKTWEIRLFREILDRRNYKKKSAPDTTKLRLGLSQHFRMDFFDFYSHFLFSVFRRIEREWVASLGQLWCILRLWSLKIQSWLWNSSTRINLEQEIPLEWFHIKSTTESDIFTPRVWDWLAIYQLNNPTQNGFLCKIVQLSDWLKIFFYVFQTLVRFGHPKVENLVQNT
jgi:hypothetical protein